MTASETTMRPGTAAGTAASAPANPPPAARPSAAAAVRRALGLLVAVAALVVICALSIVVGSKDVALGDILDVLFAGRQSDVASTTAQVVLDLRIPRTIAGLVVGISLGVAGALIQALTRNPLADPGILGVNAGAAFFVTLGIGVFGVASVSGYIWFALAGALVTTVGVTLIGAAGRGGADPARLTLAGVAVGAVLTGITTALMLLDPISFNAMRNWNAGSLVERGLDVVLPVLPFLLLGLVIAVFAAWPLNAIALGDDLAVSLGARIVRTRILVVLAVTLLAGGATAIAGPIVFVGLMVPHVARWITGPDQRWIMAYTVVLAPVLLLAADILGRVLLRPGEIPVGIVTAFLGAPILIALVRRGRVSSL